MFGNRLSLRSLLALAPALTLACATGENDSGNMSGLSAGNQTDSATDGGTDSATDGSGGSGSASASASDSMGTTTGNTTNTTNTSNSTTTGNTTNTSGETTGAGCIDNDGDGYGEGCGLGSDCNDDDYNNYTPDGCANCMDVDADDVWTGCDQYDDNKQGPDCDDNNDQVGLGDAVELCNGLAENCAGEIDPLPPDEMCPTEGEPPNVTSWLCEPPAPGQDGCKVGSCTDQFFDVNGLADDGCECQGTDYTKAIDSCGDSQNGNVGSFTEGMVAPDLVIGVIPKIDNGVGSGAEDWYWAEFPQGTRPTSGIIRVSFAQNEGSDYRFEVFRACGEAPWGASLATKYGAGAPPALEWTFDDTGPANAAYSNTVVWPSKVYIRVFRVQNDNACSKYQLKVERVND